MLKQRQHLGSATQQHFYDYGPPQIWSPKWHLKNIYLYFTQSYPWLITVYGAQHDTTFLTFLVNQSILVLVKNLDSSILDHFVGLKRQEFELYNILIFLSDKVYQSNPNDRGIDFKLYIWLVFGQRFPHYVSYCVTINVV